VDLKGVKMNQRFMSNGEVLLVKPFGYRGY